ncbi:MAG: homoserine dehydrogenase [Caldiserica bacterium]|nr:MAG: homoserine dehydrogenase [Caldisericota bacterium]
MSRPVNIGIIGMGTVGESVFNIIRDRYDFFEVKIGTPIRIKKICDKKFERKKPEGIDFSLLTTEIQDVINDEEIDIVVELIGGIEPARRIILASLDKGKHVVTANKAVLASHFKEIFKKVKEKKRQVYFEASVCAGIPIIQAINEGLCANEIEYLLGILNGTTNFILTKMEEGKDFKEALREAKERGFAEADPSLDISGEDSVHKLSILSSIIFSTHVGLEVIHKEGIDFVDPTDVKYGMEEFGYKLKLLAIMKKTKEGIELRVCPTFIPKEHPLSDVRDEFNAVYLRGRYTGDMMFYGKGAGGYPAASAVISDIVYLARKVVQGIEEHLPYLDLKRRRLNVKDINDIETRYYVRFTTIDAPGVLAKIAKILGENKVSIASVVQKESSGLSEVPILMLTHRAKEGSFKKAITEIDRLNVVRRKTVFYRVEDERFY